MSNVAVMIAAVKSNAKTISTMKRYQPGAGLHCRYIQVNDETGIKCYRSREVRDISFSLQKTAAKLGLGPHCYNRFKVNGLYCYSTEHVTIREYEDWDMDEDDGRTPERRQADELMENLRDKMGYPFRDYHWKNVGFRKDGTMLCIDFGEQLNLEYEHKFDK